MGIETTGWIFKDDELLKFTTVSADDGSAFEAYVSNNLSEANSHSSFWEPLKYKYFASIEAFKQDKPTSVKVPKVEFETPLENYVRAGRTIHPTYNITPYTWTEEAATIALQTLNRFYV